MPRRKPIPSQPEIPLYPGEWEGLRRFLVDCKQKIQGLIADPTIPGSITNYAVSSVGNTGSVQILWEPVSNAASYKIYRNTTANIAGAAVIAHVFGNDTRRFVDNVLVAGTYYYWITAVNSTGFESPPTDLTGIAGTNVVTSLSTGVAPNARVEIDSVNGIRFFDSLNNIVGELGFIQGGFDLFTVRTLLAVNQITSTSSFSTTLHPAANGGVTSALQIDNAGAAGIIRMGTNGFGALWLTVDATGLTLTTSEAVFFGTGANDVKIIKNGTNVLEIQVGNASTKASLSAANITGSGTVTGAAVTATGAISGASASISGAISGTTITSTSGDITAAANLSALGGQISLGVNSSNAVRLHQTADDELTIRNSDNSGDGNLIANNITINGTLNYSFGGSNAGTVYVSSDGVNLDTPLNLVDGILY